MTDVAQPPETLERGPGAGSCWTGPRPHGPGRAGRSAGGLDAGWADPRRLYAEGRQARRLLDDAREAVASGLGVRPPEVSFLPSGPVALSAAVEGIRYAGHADAVCGRSPGAVEHSAVLVPARAVAAASDRREPAGGGGGGRRRTGAVGRVGRRPRRARGPSSPRCRARTVRWAPDSRWAARGRPAGPRGIPLVVDAQAGLGRGPGSGGLRRAGRRRPVVGWAGRGRGARRAGADPVATSRSGERGRVRTDRRGAGGAAGARGGRGVAGDGRGPRGRGDAAPASWWTRSGRRRPAFRTRWSWATRSTGCRTS